MSVWVVYKEELTPKKFQHEGKQEYPGKFEAIMRTACQEYVTWKKGRIGANCGGSTREALARQRERLGCQIKGDNILPLIN
jgi:hypothetical protein